MVDALGGERAYSDYDLDNYVQSATNKAALEAALSFDPVNKNLYLHGPVGTGKSHLATIAARPFIRAQGPCATGLVRKPMQIFREMRACEDADGETEIVKKYIGIRTLILEDLGVEKLTEFAHQVLYEIVDGRYMAKRNGLIVTSNLDLDQMFEKIGDDRIPSRLAGMCRVVSLKGEPDHRVMT